MMLSVAIPNTASQRTSELSLHYSACASTDQQHGLFTDGRGDFFGPDGSFHLPSLYTSAPNTPFDDTNYNLAPPRKDSYEAITMPRATFENLCPTCRTSAAREASVTTQCTTPRYPPQRVPPVEQASSYWPLSPPAEHSHRFLPDPSMKPGKTIWPPDEPMRPRPPQKPFQCHHCAKEFPKKADRDRHEASVHRSQMEAPPLLWPCKVKGCTRSKGFTRKDNLLDHLRRVHNQVIPKRNTRRNGRMMGLGVPAGQYYGGR